MSNYLSKFVEQSVQLICNHVHCECRVQENKTIFQTYLHLAKWWLLKLPISVPLVLKSVSLDFILMHAAVYASAAMTESIVRNCELLD